MIATLVVNVLIFIVVSGLTAGPFLGLWVFVQGCKVIKRGEIIVPPGWPDSGKRLTGRKVVFRYGYCCCVASTLLFCVSTSLLQDLFFGSQ